MSATSYDPKDKLWNLSTVYKKTGKQIGPHMKQNKCEKLIKDGAVYGFAKPFRIVKNLE